MQSCQCDAPLHGVTALSKPATNIAASVRQRLLNRAREKQEDFALLLTKYALERVLYRLSQSKYERIFVLKGALLFELWTEQAHRPTRDADFLGQGDNDPGRLEAIFRIPGTDLPRQGVHRRRADIGSKATPYRLRSYRFITEVFL